MNTFPFFSGNPAVFCPLLHKNEGNYIEDLFSRPVLFTAPLLPTTDTLVSKWLPLLIGIHHVYGPPVQFYPLGSEQGGSRLVRGGEGDETESTMLPTTHGDEAFLQ